MRDGMSLAEQAKLDRQIRSIDNILSDSADSAEVVDETVARWDDMLDRGEEPDDLFELPEAVKRRFSRGH